MKITWLAHAAFALDNGQARLCIDPHRPGALGGRFQLPPIVGPFDAVVISHAHEDHAGWTPALGTDFLLEENAEFMGFSLQFRAVPHDDCGGCKAGFSKLIKVTTDAGTVVHCGDIGAWNAADIAWLGDVDVLLVPVGDVFTIGAAGASALVDAVAPRCVVPMHAADERVDLPLRPIDDFLQVCQRPVVRQAHLDLGATLPDGHTVLLHCP